MKRIAIVALLLALAAFARYQVFRLHEKEIAPDFYQRKMRLEDFCFPEGQIPQGFRLAAKLPGAEENPGALEASAAAALATPRLALPFPNRIAACRAASYESTIGDRVTLVACEYGPETTGPAEAPEPPPGFLKDGRFLVTTVGSAPAQREAFLNGLSARIDQLKKVSLKVNKLKTIGNVILKLFMDLLVGAFVFILLLFLTKYFLIIKTVEN